MNRIPVALVSDAVLAARLAELMGARTRLDSEIQRVTRALIEREAGARIPAAVQRVARSAPGRKSTRPIEHGEKGYRAGCPCPKCKRGHAQAAAERRARSRALRSVD